MSLVEAEAEEIAIVEILSWVRERDRLEMVGLSLRDLGESRRD